MSDEWKEILKTIATLLFGGGVTFLVQHYRRPAEIKDEHEKNVTAISNTSTETISILIQQVNGLIERDIQKEKRIRELEETNKQYINAYNRAFVFIKKRVPVEDIPDFMVTQDLIKVAKAAEKI